MRENCPPPVHSKLRNSHKSLSVHYTRHSNTCCRAVQPTLLLPAKAALQRWRRTALPRLLRGSFCVSGVRLRVFPGQFPPTLPASPQALRETLSLESFRSRDDLAELHSDLGLPHLVVLQLQLPDHFSAVLRGCLHSRHAGALLGAGGVQHHVVHV